MAAIEFKQCNKLWLLTKPFGSGLARLGEY